MLGSNEKVKGVILMIVTCVFFAANASIVKLISHIEAAKTSLSRFVIGFIIVMLMAATGKINLKFENYKLLFARGLLGGVGIFLMYLSIIKLGVSKGMILVATYPIFAYIFSVILIREKPSLMSALAVLTAFVGIIFVMSSGNGTSGFFASFGIYELLAASVGVIGGLVIVIIRKLHQTDNSYSIYFWQCLMGLLILAGPSRIWQSSFTVKDMIVLLLVGITATIGQLMMTQSYKYLPVKTGATLMMLEPTFCYISGVVIFHELLSAYSVIGSALIIGSCIAVVMFDRRKNQ